MNRITPKLFNTVSELKAAHDECFIRLAYRIVLEREADSEALIYFSQHLRKSISPRDVLTELIHSDEFNERFQLAPASRHCTKPVQPLLNCSSLMLSIRREIAVQKK
jgi:hypothetical protein